MARIAVQPGSRLVDYLLPEALLVDEEKAREPPCRCLGDACFKGGIIGPLTPQLKEFCPEDQREDFDEPVAKRVRIFMDAAKDCPPIVLIDVVSGEERTGSAVLADLEKRYTCLCAELLKRGLDVC